MLQRTFYEILTYYALIDDKGNYKEVSKPNKRAIERTISNTLREVPAFKMLKSHRIIIKEGIDEINGFKIYIYNTHCSDSTFKKGLFLIYSFENDGSKVSFSLNHGRGKLNPDNFKSITNNLKSSININSRHHFTKKMEHHGEMDSDAIILTTYSVKNLEDYKLRDDLKWLYGVYFNLCNDYKSRIEKVSRNVQKEKEKKKKEIFGNKKTKLLGYYRKILNSYGKVDFEGNFNTKFTDSFKEEIINLLYDILNSFPTFQPLKKYFQIYVQEGIKNKNGVNIYIWYNRYFDSPFSQGIYIAYSFDISGETFSVSIKQGTEFPHLDKRKSIAKKYRQDIINHKYVKKYPIIKLNEFLNNKKSDEIVHKNYNQKIKANSLVKDLNLVFNLYAELCGYYKIKLDELHEEIEAITFYEYLINKGYFFSKDVVENYLLSLKVKPFVILTGNSGTGKTKLSQLFAEYLEGSVEHNYSIVPVGANWTENRNVVGYYNVLTKSYQHTQSLDLILRAKEDIDEPYFLILDEMNLSHVERYFSDFLSSMESKKPIPLHEAADVVDVPKELAIPNNLFIVGTVNVDETTYMFSPKVLDRANVLEFKTFEDIPIRDYVKINSPKMEFSGDVDYLEDPLSDTNLRENILEAVNEEFSDIKYKQVIEFENEQGLLEEHVVEKYVLLEISNELTKFNDYLEGSGFEFGYRTVNEILSFMVVAWKYEAEQYVWDNWRRYFDAQILQKILPKLHGSQMVLGETLDNLLAHCLGIETIDEIEDLSKIYLGELDVPYVESAKKLIQMKKVLEKQRYVSFIN